MVRPICNRKYNHYPFLGMCMQLYEALTQKSQIGENITKIDSEIKGKDNGIVVNYRYLLDGVNNIDSENIRIEIINSSTPCLLRPEKDDSYIYVIMPIKQ